MDQILLNFTLFLEVSNRNTSFTKNIYYFQALLIALEETDANINFIAANMTVSL